MRAGEGRVGAARAEQSPNVVSGPDAHLEYAKWICATKTPYKTRCRARATAVERVSRDPSLKALYAYRCSACHTFHLTKKKCGKALAERAAA